MPAALAHLRPIQSELDEISDVLDSHYAMSKTLVEVRRIVEESTISDDEKFELIARLNDVYRYLRVPIDAQLQDIGGRAN